jgi:hypothetical protein
VRRKTLVSGIFIFCLATATSAVAQTPVSSTHSGTADEQAACTPDVLSLCFWDIPSEDKIVACLNKNLNRLSPECRKVIEGPSDEKPDKKKH